MKRDEVKKRGWVKNAAIIFLIIMVILTFFSNDIMNRSLPEVAAQYTQSGSITARIRGSGTVSANESYNVPQPNQTRTVAEVPVRIGDEVNIGDVLVTLSGSVSDELEQAHSDLRDLELELERELLRIANSNTQAAAAARAVTAARNALSDAQRALSEIAYNDASYNAALAANNQAQAVLASATATANARQTELEMAQFELSSLGPPPGEPDSTVDQAVYDAAVLKVANATSANDLAQIELGAAERNASFTAMQLQSQNRDAWLSASSNVRNMQLMLDGANADLALAQQNDQAASSEDAIALRIIREKIQAAKDKIEELERGGNSTEITSLVSGIVTQLNISPGNQTNPNSEEPLMVIEVVDRGYSLSFAVPMQQANRVSIGDQAEVDRGWWSPEDIRATLINIRNDPQNPTTQRILLFSISGGVETGDQLNLTLSQRTENYSIIVPNGAIRSDTNGDFVLVVMSRSSPLGNRYIATRADINIIAQDDTNTAVSGGTLSNWDFVITRSSEPIEPGRQVRLVDNP